MVIYSDNRLVDLFYNIFVVSWLYSSGSVEIAHALKSIANKISTSLFKINFTGGSLDVIENLNIKKRKNRPLAKVAERFKIRNTSITG